MDAAYFSEISLPINHVRLLGELCLPPRVKALIIFSHSSGSSRFSSRNRQVATYLQDRNFGTLLFDLLSPQEDEDEKKRMDIDLLTSRLIEVTKYLETLSITKQIPIGYFGVDIGAALALKASVKLPKVFGVVSIECPLNLVESDLAKINVPLLSVFGSLDKNTLRLNQAIFQKLQCEKKLEVVTGASHSFKELGVMEKVSELSTAWFKNYLPVKNLCKIISE